MVVYLSLSCSGCHLIGLSWTKLHSSCVSEDWSMAFSVAMEDPHAGSIPSLWYCEVDRTPHPFRYLWLMSWFISYVDGWLCWVFVKVVCFCIHKTLISPLPFLDVIVWFAHDCLKVPVQEAHYGASKGQLLLSVFSPTSSDCTFLFLSVSLPLYRSL